MTSKSETPHNGAAPLQPQGSVSSMLDSLERALIEQSGCDPDEYVALMQPASGMEVLTANPQTGMPLTDPAGTPVTLLVVQALMPRTALPVKHVSVLDPTGQAAQTNEARKAFAAVPPMIRLLVRRDALGDSIREGLEAIERQTTLAGIQ